MTGSLQTKTGRKNYYVVLNRKDENGNRKPLWINTEVPVVGNNKRKANLALKKIISEYEEKERLGLAEQTNILFADYMNQWFENMKTQVQESTFESYQYALNHIVSYFKVKGIMLRELKPEHIQKYYTDKINGGLCGSTIQKHHSNIHKALNIALKYNLIPYNPADRVQLPKKQKYQAKTYNEQQIKKLIQCARGNPIEAAVVITSYLGLRRSEVLGLKWTAVDFKANTLLIQTTVVRTKRIITKDTTKNKSSHRTLPIPAGLVKYLKDLLKRQEKNEILFGNCYNDNEWICKKEDGTPITPTGLSYYYKKLLKDNGLPHIRFHDLRHSTASILINSGCELYEIKELLGHSQIATTADIYGHLDFKAKQRMAAKINELLG
ncbi:MAG: site-specific integrase [Clostridiaceae bacterium]|nr:site-specific integrase [Clostridiaceae bacterium]